MYQKIMTAKLVIPETISSDAASLLRGLLERDPNKRLQGIVCLLVLFVCLLFGLPFLLV
jgi:hypothetical protein